MSKFDITKHKFFDSNIRHDGETLNADYNCQYYGVDTLHLDFSKQDAIAMAKHFELTAEDLEKG